MDERACLIGINRVFSTQDFPNVLGNCKILLSPYGLGEYSWKDFEAMYAGCILLKPPSSHVVTSGVDLYDNGKYCVEVDSWFTNLDHAVDSILADVSHYEGMVMRAKAELLRASHPTVLAEQFASLVCDALAE